MTRRRETLRPDKAKWRLFRILPAPLRSGKGQALVEFAMVASVFLVMIFGIIDVGRLFESWVTVQHAAREGARYALTGRGDCDIATDNRLACIQYNTQHAAVGLTDPDTVNVSVKSWYYPNYPDPPHLNNPGVACDEVEVDVSYDHHLITPIISSIFSHVTLKGSNRVLNEPFGICGQGH